MCLYCCLPICLQVITMYWALLQLGRRLIMPAEFAAAVPSVIEYQEVLSFDDPALDVHGSLAVDLMFPATESSVQRLLAAWWDVQVRSMGIASLLLFALQWQAARMHALLQYRHTYAVLTESASVLFTPAGRAA